MGYGDVPEKIKSKVEEVGGCWMWTGYSTRNRPHVRFKGGCTSGQRASYQIFVGPVPDDMAVTNECGNTMCVNPEHLRLATRSEISKKSARSLPFSEDDLQEMEDMYRRGMSTHEIARKFGCLSGSIHRRLVDRGVEMRPRGRQKKRGHFHSNGYVKLGDSYVHRIVAAAWYRPLKDGEHVHHIDGDKTNNHPDNLRILPAAEHHRQHMTPERAREMSKEAQRVRWGYVYPEDVPGTEAELEAAGQLNALDETTTTEGGR